MGNQQREFTREIRSHRGSAIANRCAIHADERDDNGGSHQYEILLDVPGIASLQYIIFQNGPVLEVGLNGISDEALIAIVIDRLEGFNTGPYRSRDNSLAITKLEEALMWLQKRTRDRENRGVEGTSAV